MKPNWQQAPEHVLSHIKACRCRRSMQLHKKGGKSKHICMDVHPFSPHRVKFNIRITHTDTNSHHILKSLSQNPYQHIQTQIQLQGHRCQSIISLIFCILLLSLQLSRTHIARCVLTPFALWTSFSLTQKHIFSPCFVIDKPYFCHPERLRHLGVKGCSLPLSFLSSSLILHPLLLFLSASVPPSLSQLPVYVCVCVSVWKLAWFSSQPFIEMLFSQPIRCWEQQVSPEFYPINDLNPP